MATSSGIIAETPSGGHPALGDANLQVLKRYTTMAQQLDNQSEGLNAWLQALGAFLVYTATWGLLGAYGSCQSYYESQMLVSTPSSAIAWVSTIDGVLLIMGGVVTGPIYDRGYIRELLLVGAFLTVFGFMMLSLASQYYQVLLAQGFCVGIGSGILCGIIYPIVFVRLPPHVGFAWTTRVLGFITLFKLIIALTIILPRAHKAGGRSPQKSAVAAAAPAPAPARSLIDVNALKEPAFAALCLALFFMWISFWVPFFFIPTFGQYKVGASPSLSFYLLVVANAATLPGRLLTVFVAAGFGVPATLLGFTLASSIILFAWAAVRSLAAFEAWIVLLGLFMGPLVVLVPAIIPLVCPNKEVVGTRMGMAWAAAALDVVVRAPVSSSLNDLSTGTFWKMQVLIGTCMMAGAVLLMFVRMRIARQKGT